jgi:transposase
MPKPLSDDLRRRILEAYESKEGSQRELAKRFGVGFEYVRKIRKHWLRSGHKERQPQGRYGPLSRITEAVRENLRGWLREQPDRTLAELREQLQASGVPVSRSRVGQVVQQMGLRRKKNRSTRRSVTQKRTDSAGQRSSKASTRSRRRS